MKDKILDMPLGDRMKYYESLDEHEISPESHIIVRCDGHKFSSFTRGFKKPFDEILSKAMELTTRDLLEEFNATTAYTQSDEITLVIPSYKDNTIDNRKSTKHKLHNCIKENWNHRYSGRVQKMASLIAGFTTMSFNEHMKKLTYKEFFNGGVETEEDRKYIEKISNEKVGKAWFDCRVYGVDSADEAFNSVLWRYRDCIKNSKSMFSQTYCSHKELHKLNGQEQIVFCFNKTDKDWHSLEERYKSGIFIKKENYIKNTEHGEVQRSRVTSLTKSELKFSKENVEFIMKKII